MPNTQVTMDKIVSLSKRRGFVFPGSEIYGGLANSWDYGPLGVELKNNLRDWWWQRFVRSRLDMVGLDAAILMNPKVWEASGHVASFSDAMIDCKQCKTRHRADHLIENAFPEMHVDGKSPEELQAIIIEKGIQCPKCGTAGQFTDARKFNLLFETSIGSVEGGKNTVYLRGEIAQAMFVNFKNVLMTTRKRLPFGIASIGKAFRNEITPGNFIFRTLEFDLMEFEYFVDEKEWEQHFAYWVEEQQKWLAEIGFDPSHLRIRQHTPEELAHYSKKTVDVEYDSPFGWKEMFGCAYRTNFDLANHAKHSGEELVYTDPDTHEKTVPHVIEPTFGLTRLMLMTMLEAYREEEAPTEDGGVDTRIVLKLHPRLAPFKVAVLPLMKKEPLGPKAKEVFDMLIPHMATDFDVTGSIGKRYRRQDEVGTPFCVTIDFDTIEQNTVTVRERDSMKQERVAIADLQSYLVERLH